MLTKQKHNTNERHYRQRYILHENHPQKSSVLAVFFYIIVNYKGEFIFTNVQIQYRSIITYGFH